MTRPRVDPSTLGRVQHALEGRCFDCRGEGERKNLHGSTVKCPTCNGSGQLGAMTFAQVSSSAAITVAKTVDALLELESSGIAERSMGTNGSPDLWRPKRRAGWGLSRLRGILMDLFMDHPIPEGVSDSIRALAKCAPANTRGIAEESARRELLRLRAALGLSQLRLAQELEVATSTVEDWERKAARVPAWALIAMRALIVRKAAL